MLSLPYTICFCLRGDLVLMLYRSNPPNAARWNGLGGKIEAGETPLVNIQREMLEEAAIDLHEAQEVHFAGIVTWNIHHDSISLKSGMYVFLAQFAPNFPIWPDHPTSEGLLSWKAVDWVCDQSNSLVVDNISHFLPCMLADPKPQEYYCSYQKGILQMNISQREELG